MTNVFGNIVYVATSNANNVFALDAKNGEMIWKFQTDYGSVTSPAISNGFVYVSTHSNYVIALDAKNGEMKWNSKTTYGYVSSPITVSEDVVYVISQLIEHKYFDTDYHTRIQALNAKTGYKIWSRDSPDEGLGHTTFPVVSGKIVYGNSGFSLIALDKLTGSFIWAYSDIYPNYKSPLISGGFLFILNENYLYTFDAETGEIKWKYKINEWEPSYLSLSPSLSNGVFFSAYGPYLYAFRSDFDGDGVPDNEDFAPEVHNLFLYIGLMFFVVLIILIVQKVITESKRKLKQETISLVSNFSKYSPIYNSGKLYSKARKSIESENYSDAKNFIQKAQEIYQKEKVLVDLLEKLKSKRTFRDGISNSLLKVADENIRNSNFDEAKTQL